MPDTVDEPDAAVETSQGLLSDLVRTVRGLKTDTARVEVKAAGGGVPKSVWESVSAFANTDGGVVVLGLDEAHGFAPASGFDARRVRDQVISGLEDRQTPRVTPKPPYSIDTALVDGSPVVVIDIAPLELAARPCYVVAQGVVNGSYHRVGDADMHLSAYAISLLQSNRQQPVFDRDVVPGADLEDLDQRALDRFLDRLHAHGRAALEDRPDRLEALQRLTVTRGEDPTLAGLLAFGRFPQQFFPQLIVSVAVFPTVDGTETAVRLLDSATVDGAIPRMVEMATAAVVRNLRQPLLSSGLGGESVLELPEGVLREAITNALMHRDYSPLSLGAQVQVEVFPDRIEIRNPGGIWGGRSVTEAVSGGSHSRNSVLANLLSDAEFPSRPGVVAENKGTGLRRMASLMKQAGLPEPILRDSISEFSVTLVRPDLAKTAAAQAGPEPVMRWRGQSKAVYDHLGQAAEPLTAAELSEALALTRRQVTAALDHLIEAGLVRATAPARSPARAYEVVAL